MENKNVYIVTSGDYSDYSIDAVFSTKEKAEEYLDTEGSDARIEEYELDKKICRKNVRWDIYFLNDGSVNMADPYSYYNPKEYEDRVMNVKNGLCFSINSDSKEKAIKIASERRAFVLSNPYMFPLLFVECCNVYSLDKRYIISRHSPTYNFKTCEILKLDYDRIDGRWLRLAQIVKNPNSTEEEFNEAAIELGLKQKPTPKRDVKVIEILPGKGEKE